MKGESHGNLFQRFVNHVRVLEVVVRKEVELVQKVPDVDAAEGVHLREGQNTREPVRG